VQIITVKMVAEAATEKRRITVRRGLKDGGILENDR